MEQTIKFNEYIQPIEIVKSLVPTNVDATIVGWGYRNLKTSLIARYLWKNTARILHPNDCQNYHQSIIYDNQFCALSENGGTCHGDSGGPFIWNNKLIGLVSWGIPCASGVPDVFTNVNHHLDFINSIIN
uniref:Peptidase S1 domain-containing protein n=1 Tax=Bracon brevicornis TaxID=1563983 RepID=A0A6V7KK87_9HYME